MTNDNNQEQDKGKQIWDDFSKVAGSMFSGAVEATRNVKENISQKVDDFKANEGAVDREEFEALKKRVELLEAMITPKKIATKPAVKKPIAKPAAKKTTTARKAKVTTAEKALR